ncbi:MAG: GNAT family N-acetyltransferase [Planctomycetota bacterium]|nr:MAG: GNAT family N-acetyltransferase [Planctomycetota bacterium]
MNVRPLTTSRELAVLESAWNDLDAGVPFRSFAWLTTWWQCYGDDAQGANPDRRELLVLAVEDPQTGETNAIAPWFVDRTRAEGNVIRWLGSGEVCSDYLSVLCAEGREGEVAAALADWLVDPAETCWTAIDLGDVATDDALVALLAEELRARGASVHRRAGTTCWRLELSTDWETYLKRLSKTRRKRTRGLLRDWFDCGRAELFRLTSVEDVEQAMPSFEELHQKRRRSLGQAGCFASPRFARFLRTVAPRMAAEGRLEIAQLSIDGRTAAFDFNLLGRKTIYSYQSGLDPATLEQQPGHLITIAELRQAIERKFTAYDFLRGDEPYKHNWRAAPQETTHIRVVANRTRARLAHMVWNARQQTRDWARTIRDTTVDAREQLVARAKGLVWRGKPG